MNFRRIGAERLIVTHSCGIDRMISGKIVLIVELCDMFCIHEGKFFCFPQDLIGCRTIGGRIFRAEQNRRWRRIGITACRKYKKKQKNRTNKEWFHHIPPGFDSLYNILCYCVLSRRNRSLPRFSFRTGIAAEGENRLSPANRETDNTCGFLFTKQKSESALRDGNLFSNSVPVVQAICDPPAFQCIDTNLPFCLRGIEQYQQQARSTFP